MKILSILLTLFTYLFFSNPIYASCAIEVGTIFDIHEPIEIAMYGGDTVPISPEDNVRLQVRGEGKSWGCAVFAFDQDGRRLTNELLLVSEGVLKSLKSPRDNLVLNEIKKLNREKKLGDAPCADCTLLDKSLRPKLRPTHREIREIKRKRGDDKVRIDNLSISNKGLDLIMRHEGFMSRFYEDGERLCTNKDPSYVCKTGTRVYIPTIGYGIQIRTVEQFNKFCQNVLKGQGCDSAKVEWLSVLKTGRRSKKNTLSKQQARDYFRKEVKKRENWFRRDYGHIELKQHEYDALMSLYFNGEKYFRIGHKSDFNKELSGGNTNLLRLAKHMHDIGPETGNYKRRLDEINLLLFGNYEVITATNDIEFPNHAKLRSIYKEIVNSWSKVPKMRFWETNPEYRYFINKVRKL